MRNRMLPDRRPTGIRGTTALEFALILPTFLLILMGVMDFGWLFFQRASLDMAATVGCRAGALVDPGDGDVFISDVEDAVYNAMETELIRAGAGECEDCYTAVTPYGLPPGRSLLCEVQRDVEPLVGLTVRPTTLGASMAVRMEWQRWP